MHKKVVHGKTPRIEVKTEESKQTSTAPPPRIAAVKSEESKQTAVAKGQAYTKAVGGQRPDFQRFVENIVCWFFIIKICVFKISMFF